MDEQLEKAFDQFRSIPSKSVTMYDSGERVQFLVKGSLPGELFKAVGVIGTRMQTALGSEIAHGIGRFLGENRIRLISGFAPGIDYSVTVGAVEAGGRVTSFSAVSDIQTMYDPTVARLNLMTEMIAHGSCLLALQNMKSPLERNRFNASGNVLVVVEGSSRSGSSKTVEIAMQLGRHILCPEIDGLNLGICYSNALRAYPFAHFPKSQEELHAMILHYYQNPQPEEQ